MDHVEPPAARGQFEALGPAVDGDGREGLPVEGGPPAVVRGVGQLEHAPGRAFRHVGVDLDGAGGDGEGLGPGALLLGGDDHGAGDVAVHPPQRALLLAEALEAGRGVEHAVEAGR